MRKKPDARGPYLVIKTNITTVETTNGRFRGCSSLPVILATWIDKLKNSRSNRNAQLQPIEGCSGLTIKSKWRRNNSCPKLLPLV
jgi:hypothetical protein